MNQHVSRRTLVSAASSVAMVPALATLMTVHAESAAAIEVDATPILAQFRQWVAFENWLNTGTAGMPEQEFTELVSESCRMAERIGELDISCPSDFAAKYLALTTFGNGTLNGEVYDWDATLADEAAQILGTTVAELKGGPAAPLHMLPVADAELVRLGEEFDRAALAYMAVQPRRHATYEAWSSELNRLNISDSRDPRYESLLKTTGYGPAADESSDLTNTMIGLHAQMVVLPAITLHGMAAKATAIAWDAGDYGFPGENDGEALDFGGFWDIVDELRAIAGLPSIAALWAQAAATA